MSLSLSLTLIQFVISHFELNGFQMEAAAGSEEALKSGSKQMKNKKQKTKSLFICWSISTQIKQRANGWARVAYESVQAQAARLMAQGSRQVGA